MSDASDPGRQRPEITYPCVWSYRIVGTDEGGMRAAVAEAVGTAEHTLVVGRESRSGRYRTLNLELQVADEARRLSIYEVLIAHDAVRVVL